MTKQENTNMTLLIRCHCCGEAHEPTDLTFCGIPYCQSCVDKHRAEVTPHTCPLCGAPTWGTVWDQHADIHSLGFYSLACLECEEKRRVSSEALEFNEQRKDTLDYMVMRTMALASNEEYCKDVKLIQRLFELYAPDEEKRNHAKEEEAAREALRSKSKRGHGQVDASRPSGQE